MNTRISVRIGYDKMGTSETSGNLLASVSAYDCHTGSSRLYDNTGSDTAGFSYPSIDYFRYGRLVFLFVYPITSLLSNFREPYGDLEKAVPRPFLQTLVIRMLLTLPICFFALAAINLENWRCAGWNRSGSLFIWRDAVKSLESGHYFSCNRSVYLAVVTDLVSEKTLGRTFCNYALFDFDAVP